MEKPIIYLGVSVTSEALETELDGQSFLTLNCAEGHAHLLSRLSKVRGSLRIVCEQADGSELAVVRALHAAGFTVGLAVAEGRALACLPEAPEISPSNLARFAVAHPACVKFIPGNTLPNRPAECVPEPRILQSELRRRHPQCSVWMRLSQWFAVQLSALKRRRLTRASHQTS